MKYPSWRGGTTKPSAEQSLSGIIQYLYSTDGFSFFPTHTLRENFAKTGNFIFFANINIMEYGGCVYIITNFHNTVLYTGVTADLPKRIYQHKIKEFKNSFTAKYNCDKLVWYEWLSKIEDAIAREKQIKAGSRKKKEDLIHELNPHWNDLWKEIEKW